MIFLRGSFNQLLLPEGADHLRTEGHIDYSHHGTISDTMKRRLFSGPITIRAQFVALFTSIEPDNIP